MCSPRVCHFLLSVNHFLYSLFQFCNIPGILYNIPGIFLIYLYSKFGCMRTKVCDCVIFETKIYI